MAFNPFHGFRKHQKAVFAGLTIICMLTFVLASGAGAGGDFFHELSRWLGGGKGSTDVARMYGSKVTPREIVDLRTQRRAANTYMAQAINFAHNNLFEKIYDALQYNKERKDRERQTLGMWQQLAFGRGAQFGQQYLQVIGQLSFELQQAEVSLSAAKDTSASSRLRKLMADLETASRQIVWLMKVPKDPLYDDEKPRPNLYFGGSTSVDGLLDFMIWKRQADQLGIHLTDQDIKNAIMNEALHYLTRENDQLILQFLGREVTGDPAFVLHAVGEEFRVRLAQSALSGFDGDGIDKVPAPVSPYELYRYYVNNRTEYSVDFLPIPVSKYVPEVKEKPTAGDLQTLYNRYKDDLPAPEKETPGFKQPRQVKVQWIDFSPTGQVFRDEARKLLLAQIAAAVSNPALGGALGTSFLKEYESAVRPRFEPGWDNPQINRLNSVNFPLAMYTYKDLQKPDTIVSTVGLVAGGNPLGAAVAVPDRAYARESKPLAPLVAQEARRRTPVAAALLAGATALPGALGVANTWIAAGWNEEYVPPALVTRQMLKGVEDKLAETMAQISEDAFKEGLEKVRKETAGRKGKFEAAAAEYVSKQIAAHKWPHGASKQLDDLYTIAQDEGLKPLKEAYVANHFATDPKAKKLGIEFFAHLQTQEELKVFTPQTSRQGEKTFMYWTTEDVPPKILPFDTVRKQVEDAWYREKARPLAEKAAEALAAEARKSGGSAAQNLVEAAKGQPLIHLDGIAGLVPQKNPRMQMMAAMDYEPYKFPEDKIEYPEPPSVAGRSGVRADPLTKILDLKRVGDVTVFTDMPKSTYYVAAVVHRNEPSPTSTEFRQGDLLKQRLEPLRENSYREGILKYLRAQARLEVFPEGRKNLEERGSNQQDQDTE